MTESVDFYESKAGWLKIVASEKGLKAISFVKNPQSALAKRTTPSDLTLKTKWQLEEYFDGRRTEFTVPLDLQGTPFQKKVWKALLSIPYGRTMAYSDVARKIGSPKAARAIGMANNRNPVTIVVPCHRVIGKDGDLVGYGGGLSKKVLLLSIENGENHAN